MLKRIFLVSVVMAVSAVAETKATVVNYNSEWISWAKQSNFIPIPPNFTPQVHVFVSGADPDVAALRITLTCQSHASPYSVLTGNIFGGIVAVDCAKVDSVVVEPLAPKSIIKALLN